MLAEFGGRGADRARGSAEVDGWTDDRKRAVRRVIERREHPVRHDLRVGFEVAVFADDFEEEVVAAEEVAPDGGGGSRRCRRSG